MIAIKEGHLRLIDERTLDMDSAPIHCEILLISVNGGRCRGGHDFPKLFPAIVKKEGYKFKATIALIVAFVILIAIGIATT